MFQLMVWTTPVAVFTSTAPMLIGADRGDLEVAHGRTQGAFVSCAPLAATGCLLIDGRGLGQLTWRFWVWRKVMECCRWMRAAIGMDQLCGVHAVVGFHHKKRPRRGRPRGQAKEMVLATAPRLPRPESSRTEGKGTGHEIAHARHGGRHRPGIGNIRGLGPRELRREEVVDSEPSFPRCPRPQMVAFSAVRRRAQLKAMGVTKSTSCRKPSPRTSTNPKTLAKAFSEITGIKVNHDSDQ